MSIDMNRPLMTRGTFDKQGKTGPKIYMYKDAPGVYYDAHGKEVPAVLAELAGFDVNEMEQLKLLSEDKDRVLRRYKEMTGPAPQRRVTEIRPNGHRLICIGPDMYHIEDADGNQVTSAPLSRYYAVTWLNKLDPADGEEKVPMEPMPKGGVTVHEAEVVEELPVPVEDLPEVVEEEPLMFPSTKSKK